MKQFIFYLFCLLLITGCYDSSNINYKPNKFLSIIKIDSVVCSFYESGKISTQTFYGTVKKQPFIKVVSFFESGSVMHEVTAFENRTIGIEKTFFENGKLSTIRKYQLNSRGKPIKRNHKNYFSDDFFINGIKATYKDFNCIVETSILQEEFYENGEKQQEILYDKSKDYLKIVRYNIHGKIESINPISFNFLTNTELFNLITNKINCDIGKSIILDVLTGNSNKIPCWFYNGVSKYYSETGVLIKEEFWVRGILKETKEYDEEGNLIEEK